MRRTRILHTADWHLGHSLLAFARDHEHRCFLRWLVDRVVEEQADLLVIAGDVFDGRSPSGAAQAAYFGFLATLRAEAPATEVVVIAGNHDSPSRLSATGPVLGPMGVHVIGAASPSGSSTDLARVVRTRAGHALGVAAVPFVRPSDLAGVGDGLDPQRVQAALRRLYRDVVGEVQRMAPGAPIIATGHAHVRGALLSPRSERMLFGGEAGAIEGNTFPEACAYVALGHLHLAQDVGAQRVRYAGSPIPLALAESDYRHTISRIDLEDDHVASVTEHPVPRAVPMVRIEAPSTEMALAQIERLPRASDVAPAAHAWLEVRLQLDASAALGPARAQIEAAIAERAARLVRLAIDESAVDASADVDARASDEPADLDVRAVMAQRWREVRGTELGDDHLQALDTAVQHAMHELDEQRRDETAGAVS